MSGIIVGGVLMPLIVGLVMVAAHFGWLQEVERSRRAASVAEHARKMHGRENYSEVLRLTA